MLMMPKTIESSKQQQAEQMPSAVLAILFSGLMATALSLMLAMQALASDYGASHYHLSNDVSHQHIEKPTQCFSDANQAYAYLLAQQAQQQTAQQAVRDRVMVNINTATEGELATLDGIGSSKAQAIILYRQAFGKFASVDELTRVKGIGEKTVENNRQRLTVQ